jgi:dTDP-4-amino-4,6-dideoxygalactose transaminase
MDAKRQIPFALPSIGPEEKQAVAECLDSKWLTTGPKTKQFEAEFAAFVGSEHALAVSSCTAGMHLALEALGVGAGDRVITTPYTFTATAEVIRYLGADPLFVDIDSATLNIDPVGIEAALAGNANVKAIMPVHIAGLPCPMNEIMALAQRYQLPVVEDAAHAFPCQYDGRMIGAISDVTVFSFYVTKTLATGEGGMLTTDRPEVAERARAMRLHGISRDVFDRYTSDKPKWFYEVVAPGFKYNLSDIASAIGLEQLKKTEQMLARRTWIAGVYQEALADLPLALPPQSVANGASHSWHLFVLRLDADRLTIDRNRFIELMAERGVGTSVHFIPLHLQPYWRDRYGFAPDDFPAALAAYAGAVSLPIYPAMSDDDVEYVAATARTLLAKHAR